MFGTSDLIALLGSRICHDLISPIGAISNGVELLMMDGGSMGPEIALIAESVANANARIQFFRVAFGASSPDQRIGRAEVVSILTDLTRGGRLTIEWRCANDLPRREVKLAFLFIQCLETAMAFGGRIIVDQDQGKWSMTGSAAKFKMVQDLWDGLASNTGLAHINAAQVHFALVQIELQSQNRILTTDIGPTEIAVHF